PVTGTDGGGVPNDSAPDGDVSNDDAPDGGEPSDGGGPSDGGQIDSAMACIGDLLLCDGGLSPGDGSTGGNVARDATITDGSNVGNADGDIRIDAGAPEAGGTDAAVCGNGVLEGNEGCDDGNALLGDGCSDQCTIESGYFCAGTPSACGAWSNCV